VLNGYHLISSLAVHDVITLGSKKEKEGVEMLTYVVVFLLIMHGLAHMTGVVGFWTSGSRAFGDQAWIFSQGVSARSLVGRAWGLLWLVAGIGLIATGLGLLFGQAWWPSLAVGAAIVSLLAIVPWLRVVPPGAWAGALLDVLIIASLALPWSDRIIAALG
jgi:hypothetical protein